VSTPASKVTVATTIRCNNMAMESTGAAIEVIRGVMAELYVKYKDEITQALEDAGAKDVTVQMIAY
jgi:hypothetical protein